MHASQRNNPRPPNHRHHCQMILVVRLVTANEERKTKTKKTKITVNILIELSSVVECPYQNDGLRLNTQSMMKIIMTVVANNDDDNNNTTN